MKFFKQFSFLIILNLFNSTIQYAQVFQETERMASCSIPLKIGKKIKNTKVPASIDVENSEYSFIFSFCGKNRKDFPNSQTCIGYSCLYLKDTKKLISQGNASYILDDEIQKDEVVFRVLNQFSCKTDKNYEIIIKMVSSPSLKKPTLLIKDVCELEIQILKPDYTPPCTYLLDNRQLIDLRPLKREKISTPFKGGMFNIAVCGAAVNSCDPDEAGCFTGNGSFVFGSTKTQLVKYDSNKNEIKVIASVVDNGAKRNMEVRMRCNWTVPHLANLKYLEPPIVGRNYKFEVDSSFACIKLPFSCVYKDKGNHLTYDLRKLYKKNGYRIDRNSSSILLNICGSLSVKGPKGNDCDIGHSQVCTSKNGAYINKGSIPLHEVVDENFVRIKFIEGTVCNVTEKYETIIDFRCSSNEEGPIFSSEEGCKLKLLWRTPKACPNVEITSDSCLLQTDISKINISALYTDQDKEHVFAQNEKFRFNICGNLHSNCSNDNSVTACLTKNNQERIIGWNQPQLSYINGKIQLKYEGERCHENDAISWSLTLNLICNLNNDKAKPIKLTKSGPCGFSADVFTSHACFLTKKQDCTVEDETAKYNLTGLIAKERNYRVKDEEDVDLLYMMNVCAPLINEQGIMLLGNSMVALMNKTEPHIAHRFVSLGKAIGPSLENGKLVVHSKLGFYCKENLGNDYNSKIFFECSENEQLPVLIKKESCSYEFLWKTKHACPIVKAGGTCSLNIENDKISIPSDGIELILDEQKITYTFHLCFDEYKICKAGRCRTNKLHKKSEMINDEVSVQLDLSNSSICTQDDPLKKVNLKMICDEGRKVSVSIENDTIRNCEISVLVKSKRNCRNVPTPHRNIRITNGEESAKNSEIPDIITKIVKFTDRIGETLKNSTILSNSSKEKYNKIDIVKEESVNENTEIEETVIDKKQEVKVQNNTKAKIKSSSQSSCANLKNIGFDLKHLRNAELNSENSKYVLNFDGSSPKCGGFICKNGKPLLNFIESCPETVAKEETFVEIRYQLPGCHNEDQINPTNASLQNNNFHVELILECNKSSGSIRSFEESSCKVSFHGNSPQICHILGSDNGTSLSISIVVFIITTILILVVGLILYIIHKNNLLKKCSYLPVGNVRRDTESMIHFKIP